MSVNSPDKVNVSAVPESEEVPEPESSVCESDNLENGILLFGDGDPSWLSSLLASVVDRERWRHESLLTCLVVIMYEMGLHLDPGPVTRSLSFDARVMRRLKSSDFLSNSDDDGAYRLNFRAPDSDESLTMALVPVDSIGLIDLVARNGASKSLAFDCGRHFNKIDGRVVVANRDKLAMTFKTEVFKVLTDLISHPSSHPGSILSLPIELLIKISSYLSVPDFVRFTMCSKILHSLSDDEVIWRELAKWYLPCRNLSGSYKEFCKYQYKIKLESTYQSYWNVPDIGIPHFLPMFDCHDHQSHHHCLLP